MRRALIGLAVAATILPGPGGSIDAAAQADAPALRNQLAEASSPYLRSAAKQAVHWQEWSNDVFALARKLDRPIYLDIGAIWCHWCHEMDRESYENPDIAALINQLFIPVKVDRDVRPDIDTRYQAAVAELSGSGGWPLTVFLTPDGNVFYGGTYLPPDTLKAVLPQAAQGYRKDRERIASTAQALRRHVAALSAARAATLSGEVVEGVVDHIRRSFDAGEGGFASAPKFPTSNAVTLLIDRYVADRRSAAAGDRDADARQDGGRRHSRSALRTLSPLHDRPVLAAAALRGDALHAGGGPVRLSRRLRRSRATLSTARSQRISSASCKTLVRPGLTAASSRRRTPTRRRTTTARITRGAWRSSRPPCRPPRPMS